jgi:hypothetical protein
MFPCEEAQKPEHSAKNRWRNVLPYDATRVILKPLPRQPNSHYINANYVKVRLLKHNTFSEYLVVVFSGKRMEHSTHNLLVRIRMLVAKEAIKTCIFAVRQLLIPPFNMCVTNNKFTC